jgi:hypothetical protein
MEYAWAEMWEVFKPIVNHLEQTRDTQRAEVKQLKADAKAAAKAARALSPDPGSLIRGLPSPDAIAAHLDPDYSQPDPALRLRDALLWTVENLALILSDPPNSPPTINLDLALSPPPSPSAVFILAAYAAKPPPSRIELLTRCLPFVPRQLQPDGPQGPQAAQGDDGGFPPSFLDTME